MGITQRLEELGEQNADELSRSLGEVADRLLALSPEELQAVHVALQPIIQDLEEILELQAKTPEGRQAAALDGMSAADIAILVEAYGRLGTVLDRLKQTGPVTIDLRLSADTVGGLAENLANDENFARTLGVTINRLAART